MNDRIVSLLYNSAKEFVEAIGMEAFKDFGEIANADTKARLNQLQYAVKVAASYKPKYQKPYEVTFIDDNGVTIARRCYADHDEAQRAQELHLTPPPRFVFSILLDKRKLWK